MDAPFRGQGRSERPTMIFPSLLLYLSRMARMGPPLRASNEGLLRPRVARAQGTHRAIPPLLAGFFSILPARSTPGAKATADKRLGQRRSGREAERCSWDRGNQSCRKTRLIVRRGCSRLSSRGGRFDVFCQQCGRLCSADFCKQALCLVRMRTVRIFLCQQRQFLTGPIVRSKVVVAECQKV